MRGIYAGTSPVGTGKRTVAEVAGEREAKAAGTDAGDKLQIEPGADTTTDLSEATAQEHSARLEGPR